MKVEMTLIPAELLGRDLHVVRVLMGHKNGVHVLPGKRQFAQACLERGERFYFNYPVMLTLKEAAERYFDIVAFHDPGFAVSDQERQLLLLEAAGCTASEISDRLDETDKAIQERQKNLSMRLGIVNKSASRVAKAFALGLISPSEVNFLPRS